MWQHNIFEDLIKDENDFVGKVAYSIYKQEKVRWIQHHKEKHEEYPSKDIIQKYFHLPNSRPETIARYRSEAEDSVNDFIRLTLSEELTSYKEALKDDEVLKQIKKPFWQSVKESIVAALIASFIIAIFSLGLWLYTEMKSAERRAILLEKAPISEELKKRLKD